MKDNVNKKIVIHRSNSPQGRGDDASTIHRWHKERGFDGIGYHYVILEDGTIQNGRPLYWQGAHVAGHNENSIGICLIGESNYTDSQMDSLGELVMTLHTDIGIPYDEVYGHNELSTKPCPMFNVREWVKTRFNH